MRVDDILTEPEVEAVVAGDSFDQLVERISRMVRVPDRRLSLAIREFIHTGATAKVYGGLAVDTAAFEGGFRSGRDERRAWCHFVLTDGSDDHDGLYGVGFDADIYRDSGNETHSEAWRRYKHHEAEHADYFRRRRCMTHIAISGGLLGLRYKADDMITISKWNRDGVCTEKVIGFDYVNGSWT
jgi:hypothetical protein